ncbi:putative amidohydrolase ytcJ [Cucumis melo var. makuwa]|uniref:Amidohydrolase ytcJ n=2 Tax=Cucumis melo TaxID=3656 RepID=A0A5A7T9Q4_CUCMM|nr:putative amidohydrolase ytcJ [Cucumis melo var. makuwa]TYK20536.1 putative amidohydrolase ytcJ [Cucumis melo var. makuwa]
MATLPKSLALINKAGDVVSWFPKAKQLVVGSPSCPCNLGWTTVGKFQVKFEFWSSEEHAGQKLIPSYCSWISFRGIPIHVWNMDTFLQIGNACGGLQEVDKTMMNMDNLLEAKIKVRYNYNGFIPTAIRIKDKDGHFFVVNTRGEHGRSKNRNERPKPNKSTSIRQKSNAVVASLPHARQIAITISLTLSPVKSSSSPSQYPTVRHFTAGRSKLQVSFVIPSSVVPQNHPAVRHLPHSHLQSQVTVGRSSSAVDRSSSPIASCPLRRCW